MGLDTKTDWLTDWLTDRQSQCDFDFDFDFDRLQTPTTHDINQTSPSLQAIRKSKIRKLQII
jgi:hypothetical protein